MNLQAITFIPIIISIIWAIIRYSKKGSSFDSSIIVLSGFIVLFVGVLTHLKHCGTEIPTWLNLIGQILTTLIVPIAYIFFSRQAGRSLHNTTNIILFALIAFQLFPNLIVITGDTQNYLPAKPLQIEPHTLCILNNQIETLYKFSISDLIIMMQALVTTFRIAPLYLQMRRYGLRTSSDVRAFIVWWAITVVFIVFFSIQDSTKFAQPNMNWAYHIVYMVITFAIFYLLGNGFDLRPIVAVEEQGQQQEKPVELDNFVLQSRELARRLRTLIEEKKVHLQIGYSAENAITDLGISRTYFYRMVKAEFGCTFSELLNRERIDNVKYLLRTTDYNLNVISERSGFSEATYMIKVFKQVVGKTPNDWRSTHPEK